MKKSVITISFFSATIMTVAGFISCKKTANVDPVQTLEQKPELGHDYNYESKHGVKSELAALGRVLFYDKNLSLNNSTSCGSCHKQEFAFADRVRFNKGFNGVELGRNSPSIQGIRGFKNNVGTIVINGVRSVDPTGIIPTKENQTPVRLFWDGRQTSVADMVLNPVTNHKEMNIPDFETLIKKLNSISYYPDLFKKAYGDNAITKERIAFAMQGFIACLNTPDLNKENTRFAAPNTFTIGGIAFSTTEDLSPLEQQGLFLFHAKYNCGQCHKPDNTSPMPGGGGGYGGAPNTGNDMFIDFDGSIRSFNNNGNFLTSLMNIGLDEKTKDKGLGNITGMAGDEGLFKVPTLNNISVTAPYMHDGRYATLNEVLDHYSHNIKNTPNLAPLFKNTDGTAKNMNISSAEKIALIAFLNTLKDEDFLRSPMYSDPFN